VRKRKLLSACLSVSLCLCRWTSAGRQDINDFNASLPGLLSFFAVKKIDIFCG
jgi:hypothetical protein